jgi:hypothetical protein
MVDRRTVEEGSLLADGLAGSAPSIVYGTGRVCIEPSCSVKLSRYNSTDWCALHESPASTQRPYDTSTRQPRGRRRNSRARRASTGRVATGNAATGNAATGDAAHSEPAESPAKTTRKSSRRTAA